MSETPAQAVRVTRSRRPATGSAVLSALVVVVLLSLPYVVFANVTSLLVNFFILLVLATMWNLLAGYAGLISVGQQAYIGLGAYIVLILAQNGVSPFLAIPPRLSVARSPRYRSPSSSSGSATSTSRSEPGSWRRLSS